MPSSATENRRDFLKTSARVAGTAAVIGAASQHARAFAGEDNTVRVVLVGCGGRGTGAAANAVQVKGSPVQLVGMADVFRDRLDRSYDTLAKNFADKVDVPEERKFVGFDSYKSAMDLLEPGDVVILTTPPAFRWVHYAYAIEKGLHVFMEKPVTVDGPSSRRMLEFNEKAKEKNLKVGVGLMCRHCVARGELYDRIRDGQIGDVLELRAYRMAGPTASAASGPRPEGMDELEYQIRRFHSFLWASGGAYSDFLIHNIDECCWMKDAWPVEAEATGGRHYRGDMIDQNFDQYSVEYTFDDGTKLFLRGRTMPGCQNRFASYVGGSKGSAVISARSHWPSRARIYNSWDWTKENEVWNCGKETVNPYQKEWEDLVEAIREDKAYNEVERGVEASLVTAMGRMAAHTGQKWTRDQTLNHDVELGTAPDGTTVADLTLGGPPPLRENDKGKYPVPMPGVITKREF